MEFSGYGIRSIGIGLPSLRFEIVEFQFKVKSNWSQNNLQIVILLRKGILSGKFR
jgi:hypothetical protein